MKHQNKKNICKSGAYSATGLTCGVLPNSKFLIHKSFNQNSAGRLITRWLVPSCFYQVALPEWIHIIILYLPHSRWWFDLIVIAFLKLIYIFTFLQDFGEFFFFLWNKVAKKCACFWSHRKNRIHERLFTVLKCHCVYILSHFYTTLFQGNWKNLLFSRTVVLSEVPLFLNLATSMFKH